MLDTNIEQYSLNLMIVITRKSHVKYCEINVNKMCSRQREAHVMRTAEILFGVFAALFATVEGSVTCGHTECYGSGAYCCASDSHECCWQHFPVYTYWWFWCIWFWAIFFVVLICVCIRRRRRLFSAPRYVIVEGQQSYGSVQAGYQRATYSQGFTPAMSAPAYQEKPPEYSAVVSH